MRAPADAPSVAEHFRRFALGAGRDGAPLYDEICRAVAVDPTVLELVGSAPPDQQRPTTLLAAVQYLLLGGLDDPLAARYPTVVEWRASGADGEASTAVGLPPKGDDGPATDFISFCRRHEDHLADLIATRSTQTNEIGRCAALLPALSVVGSRANAPLAVVDLGAAAGLNLLFDRYAYDYGQGTLAANRGSPVLIDCDLRTGEPPLGIPDVAWRLGIDRSPINPADLDASRWLLACVWPDHIARFRRLRAALAVARADENRAFVDIGDVVDSLSTMASRAPDDAHLCVFHTWVAAYLEPDRQQDLDAAVASIAAVRPISWLFAENAYEVSGLPLPPPPGIAEKGSTAVVLIDDGPGRERSFDRLADMHPHGGWLQWWGIAS